MKVYEYRAILAEPIGIALQPVREYSARKDKPATNSVRVSDFLCEQIELDKAADEELIVLGVDSKKNYRGVIRYNQGALGEVIADVRGTIARLIAMNVPAVFLAHNHPDGDPEPSKLDLEFTAKFKSALDLLGIQLVDHIIVGGGTRRTFSFIDEGLL